MWNQSTRVGILGAGQLAKMLSEAAFAMGLVPTVFGPTDREPACRIVPQRFQGTLEEVAALHRFFLSQEVIVFENEFVSATHLAEALRGTTARTVPSLSAYALLSDKAEQKELLSRLKLPTARFQRFVDKIDSALWLRQMESLFPKGFVLKLGKSGYDGKGLCFTPSDMAPFLERARQLGVPCYAEEKVAFTRELALVACRGAEGAFTHYPLVVSEQERGICVRILGPATAMGVEEGTEKQAVEIARLIAEASDLVGVFALEFFETGHGLLVNEIAPRVHNSGHFTQDASRTSQFENHWRAVLGLSLGDTFTAQAFGMENLLGPRSCGQGALVVVPRPDSNQHLHWYGKEVRPLRKVGHLNAVGQKGSDIPALREALIRCRTTWEGWYGQG